MATATVQRPGAPPSAVRRPRRRLLRWLVVALLVLALGAVGWLVGFSSVLAARQVTITGTSMLSTSEVRQQAGVPLGLPMIRQDLPAIAARVASLRPVERVRVERRWPDTITVQVTERQPVLAVREPGGFALVDRGGLAYATVAKPGDGVVLASVDPSNRALLTEIAAVASRLPEDFRERVGVIRADSASAIVVELESGMLVQWGTSAETPSKADVVTALLEKRAVRSIDVSSPHTPAVR